MLQARPAAPPTAALLTAAFLIARGSRQFHCCTLRADAAKARFILGGASQARLG